MRFGAALGTALKRGARVVASRESAPAYRMIKRALISGLNSTGVSGRRPAHAAGAGRQAPAEDAGLRRGVPRRRVDHRSRGGADPPVRASRASRSRRRCRRRSRSTSRARSCGASRSAQVGGDHLPGARARELRQRPARRPRRRRRSSERGFRIVVDYGYSAAQLRAAARARAARRRGGHRARVRVRLRRRRRCGCSETIEQAQRLVERGQRRLRRGLRPLGRAALPDRRARAARCRSTRRCCSTCGCSRRRGARGQGRRPDHGDEPGRGGARRAARGRAHAGVAAGADEGRGRRRASSSPARPAAATSSRSSCPPTTRSRRSASCSSCSRRSTCRSRSSSPTLPKPTLDPPVSCSARGRSRARSCASSTSATPTRDVDLPDGIKIFDERGWVQVLPDADEPLIHLYAEGESAEESEQLADELRGAAGAGDRR